MHANNSIDRSNAFSFFQKGILMLSSSIKDWIQNFKHLFSSFTFYESCNNKALARHNAPGFAHGKMYKRYTFGSSCPSLGTRFGVLNQIE
ncbi:hypothetical protein BH10BAC2_BH10BAC2_40020 [soil metagenome]